MAAPNAKLNSALLRRQVYLHRFGGKAAADLLPLLQEAQQHLQEEIARRAGALPGVARSPASQASSARLQGILASLKAQSRDLRDSLVKVTKSNLTDLAFDEVDFFDDALNRSIGVDLNNFRPAPEVLRTLVSQHGVRGQTLQSWFTKLTNDRYQRADGIIRVGLLEGATTPDLSRRLADAENITRGRAEALVRTHVNHVSNAARDEMYKENSDIISGEQWVSTLDDRTSEICAARDGNVYPLGEGPRPPAHPNCRSVMVPVLKSWDELAQPGSLSPGRGGLDIEAAFQNALADTGMEPDQQIVAMRNARASMDGAVPDDQTYGEWLRRQPPSFQDEVLGPTKGQLFRDGGLTLDKFVDERSGRALTLDEIRAQEAQTWQEVFGTQIADIESQLDQAALQAAQDALQPRDGGRRPPEPPPSPPAPPPAPEPPPPTPAQAEAEKAVKKVRRRKDEALDFSELEKIGEKPGGSVPGALFRDTKTNDVWLVKYTVSEDIARNEVLAGRLYEAAGIRVPQLRLVNGPDGKVWVASKWIDGARDLPGLRGTGALPKTLGDGFAVDAWLGNWDVIGLGYDNVVQAGGMTMRVDVGGALRYRAQGALKASSLFGPEVKELQTLLDPRMNQTSAAVFSRMTNNQLEAGVSRVLGISDEEIKSLVTKFGPTDAATRDQLAQTLIARKADLARRFPHLLDEAPPVVQAPPITQAVTDFELERIEAGRAQGYDLMLDKDAIEDHRAIVHYEKTKTNADVTVLRFKAHGSLRDQFESEIKRQIPNIGSLDSPRVRNTTPSELRLGSLSLNESSDALGMTKFSKGFVQEVEQRNSTIFGQYLRGNPLPNVEVRAWADPAKFAAFGTVEIRVPGKGREAIERALSVVRQMGVDTARTQAMEREVAYLRAIARAFKIDPGKAPDTATELRVLRQVVSKKMGVPDVTKLPKYDPNGVAQQFDTGRRVMLRPDLETDEFRQFAKDYTIVHSLAGDTVATLDRILDSGGNLMSTMDRARVGSFVQGMSSQADVGTGGASYVFTRLREARAAHGYQLEFKTDLLKRLDTVSYSRDQYGNMSPSILGTRKEATISGWKKAAEGSNNETLFKNSISVLNDISRINARSENERAKIIEVFKKHGYAKLPDGRAIEDVVKIRNMA